MRGAGWGSQAGAESAIYAFGATGGGAILVSVETASRVRAPRSGLAIALLVAVTVGTLLFLNARRSRPADSSLRGQTTRFVLPSGALEIQLPAFVTQVYGAPKAMADAGVIGLIAGNADKGNFVAVALSHPEALPFSGGGFADWVGEAYLECLATVDSEKGRNWWALDTNLELQSTPYKLKYAVARNTIPMISRVCVAGTNGVADVNVRIYGGFTGKNMERFGEDIKAMFRSLWVNEDKARQRLGIKGG